MIRLRAVEAHPAQGGALIVGGGVAGGYVARLLGKHGATIVSPENFMLYTPMLREDQLFWTVALFFRRDIAEPSMLGHPQPLRDE